MLLLLSDNSCERVLQLRQIAYRASVLWAHEQVFAILAADWQLLSGSDGLVWISGLVLVCFGRCSTQ